MSKQIDYYDGLIEGLIEENGLEELNKNEAECICLAWLLKTKLYMIGETSHEWSDKGKRSLNHEIDRIDKLD
jgi:hypothetical protein